MSTIALIGLPGSGKSTIGRHIARTWGVPFWDSDSYLEGMQGCSIKEFFALNGEDAFRALEQEAISKLVRAPENGVLSTGGGVVLRSENRRILHESTVVFYLKSTPEDIARRLRNDTNRPLLQGENPLQRLHDLLAVRSALYEETAHFVIDTVRCSSAQVVRKVIMQAELAGVVPISTMGEKSISSR